MNVLFLAAEADPFVKVGGLGDVSGALPRVIRALPPEVIGDVKLDLRLVLPMHTAVRAESLRPLTVFSLPRGGSEMQVEVFESSLEGMPVYFISGEPIRSSGSVYSLKAELDAEKYVFFSLAAMELPRQIGWNIDILHANDWHTALAAYSNLTKRWEEGANRISSLLTLHNLPFMGPDISSILSEYGLPLAQTDLPEWARVRPLPLGLWASDIITPVSPTYAAEILGPEFGCGLQDFLTSRKENIHGILNGIDTLILHSSRLFRPITLMTDLGISVHFKNDWVCQSGRRHQCWELSRAWIHRKVWILRSRHSVYLRQTSRRLSWVLAHLNLRRLPRLSKPNIRLVFA
jgi:starch synthase